MTEATAGSPIHPSPNRELGRDEAAVDQNKQKGDRQAYRRG